MSEKALGARRLLQKLHKGMLCTNSLKKPGFPYGSVTPYAVDEQGRPFFLMSGLAVHTKNLTADPRASLFVTEETEPGADPLASARANVFGEVTRMDEAEADAVREAYLELHPEAAQWVEFGDFAFYRLEPSDVYYVGGFGEMGWVSARDYQVAEPSE